MTHMTLIRHGQANTHATDEAGYDQLSELGHQQARWLGEHFIQAGQEFARVYSGTLKRHLQTAESLGAARFGEVVEDARLNEFPYYSLRAAYERQFGAVNPQTQEEFAVLLCELLEKWESNILEDVSESYASFFNRVTEVMDHIAAGDGPALIVTSGGFISTAIRHSLGFDLQSWTQTCLATLNTSVHTWQPIAGRRHITQFNAVPHLDTPDRHEAKTFI
ncbi:histidine phosphatase family protein [Cognatishimia activa]|uniref:histidine phosphatase family protein n=1 Tax=Cognatishimia activa TaxID=1715691 RepID=UPI00222E2C8D|nr:histidine phosphatase family protein [Cognatishimia activa]UZD91013.1 histidine phosphatase family protein [Cognatishimia activa]